MAPGGARGAQTGRQPRVLVAGAFGQGNPGDEGVLEAIVAGLDGCSLLATAPLDGPGDAYQRVAPSDPVAVARAALSADVVVATATVFKVLHPASGRRRHSLLVNTLAMGLATRAVGRPMVMAGVGVGSLDGVLSRALSRGIVAVAGGVEVRDEESAALLASAGVRRPVAVGADVVWTLFPEAASRQVQPPRPRRVLVALSHLAGGPELNQALAGALDLLVEQGLSVVLQPWQVAQDLPMARDVADLMRHPAEIAPAPADVRQAAATMADAGVVLGLRFHSVVAAAGAGVPFVAVSHEPKLAGLARRLEQPAVEPTADAATLAGVALDALGGPPPSADGVEAQRRAAAEIIAGLRRVAQQRAAARAGGVSLRLSRAWA